jgi:hypothetical protein
MQSGSIRTPKGVCALDYPDTCSLLVTVEHGHLMWLQSDPELQLTRLHFGRSVQAAKKAGPRVVQVDPYHNRISHRVDEPPMLLRGANGARVLCVNCVLRSEEVVRKEAAGSKPYVAGSGLWSIFFVPTIPRAVLLTYLRCTTTSWPSRKTVR